MSKTFKTTSSSSIPEKRAAPSGNDESTSHGPAACLDCRNRKVKCNRQLPECSNCKRSGVPCRFPNPEKKAGQMKQLTEDVAQLNNRLSGIETSLVGRMQELTELVTQSMQDHLSKTRRDSLHRSSSHSPSEIDDSDLEDNDLMDDVESPHPSNTAGSRDRPCSIIVADGSAERFYGPNSTYSHMIHSKGLVEKLLNAGDHPGAASMAQPCDSTMSSTDAVGVPGTANFSEVRRRYESFSGPANFQENFEMGDEKPLELPPRQVLEDSIEDYTSEYSLEPPLFNKQTLAAAVAEQYSAHPSDVDASWVLCFNNIILRSSGWRSHACRFNAFTPSRVDAKVLHLLLGNANRALRQLEKFCALRLVNIQALLLLAFIGRDLIHYNVFARIFDRVCQLAKQMGLHEREPDGESGSPEDKEAQNVLWNLYLVDKQSIFVRGPPCRIYEFECNLKLQSEDTVAQQFVSANLRLSCLVEEVYRHLYSPKAVKLGAAAKPRRVERLEGRLATLTRRVDSLASSSDKGFVENLMSSHLKYALHVTRLLILSRSSARKSKQVKRDTARNALEITQALSEGGFGLDGGVVVLERIFCNYSVIAFHEIFESLLTEEPSVNTATDLELLRSTTRALKMVSQADRPYSYCTRLHKNFVWCTEIATLVYESRRSAPASPPDRPASGNSSTMSSVYKSHGYANQVQQRPNHTSSQFSSRMTTPPQDLGGDMFMQDSVYPGSNVNSAATATTTGMNARDAPGTSADYASLRSALQPQDYLFTGGSDEFDLSGSMLPNQFVPPHGDMAALMDNSARFQEALKYALSVGGGGGLGGGFQQAMGNQMPAMLGYNRNMAGPGE